jgi:hypothetical protein
MYPQAGQTHAAGSLSTSAGIYQLFVSYAETTVNP